MRRRGFSSLAAVLSTILLVFVASINVAAQTKLTALLFNERDLDKNSIDRFMEDHPGVEVEVLVSPGGRYADKARSMIAGGVSPDLMTSNIGYDVMRFVADDLLLDLTRYIETNREHFQNWPQTVMELGQFQNKTYAILRPSVVFYAIWYNRSHFQESGLNDPGFDWTVDDFKSIARKLTKVSGAGIVERFAYIPAWMDWRPWLVNAGSRMFDASGENVTFNSPETMQALEFYRELLWEDHVVPRPGETSGDFLDGRASMITKNHKHASNVSELTTGVVPYPQYPGHERRTMITNQALMVPATSRNPSLAFELIKYMTDATSAWEWANEGLSIVANTAVMAEIANDFGEGLDIRNYRELFTRAVSEPLFTAVPSYPWSNIREIVNATAVNNEMSIPQAMGRYIEPAQSELDAFWGNNNP